MSSLLRWVEGLPGDHPVPKCRKDGVPLERPPRPHGPNATAVLRIGVPDWKAAGTPRRPVLDTAREGPDGSQLTP